LVAPRLDLTIRRVGILAMCHQTISQWSEIPELRIEAHQRYRDEHPFLEAF
jgi:hypothetical protein